MSYTINWKTIKTKIKSEDWANTLFTNTLDKTNWLVNNYNDEASRVTGWFHHYNCEKCQGRLTFNIENEKEHICSICGHINSSKVLSRVWYNMYRGQANQSVYNSAVAYNITNDKKYITHMKKVLNFYSENYDNLLSDPIAKRFDSVVL